MKKLFALISPFVFSVTTMSQNVGIGTSTPGNKLHVFKGNSGAPAYSDAPLIVESSTHCFINVLAPISKETGILFGNNMTNVDGGIIFNDPANPYGLQFRNNGNITKMVLDANGFLGIGTLTPDNKLHVFNGSAGAVNGWVQAPLVVEGSSDTYINILAPDNASTGILFGKPQNNISGGILYKNTADVNSNGFDFRTNGNITRMVLTNLGNLGLGTLNPGNYKLKIVQEIGGFAIENPVQGNSWELSVYNYLSLYANGIFKGSFNNADGSYTPISDERLKSNIRPMSRMLEKIKQLKPSTYQIKNSADTQDYNGFIAQDVLKLFPSLVVHNVSTQRNLDVYTMNYSGFGVIAVKGIQELNSIIDGQKEKIESLEARILKLETASAAGAGIKN